MMDVSLVGEIKQPNGDDGMANLFLVTELSTESYGMMTDKRPNNEGMMAR